jgi:methylenetetrahydrofolate reductase (NADPH)
MVQTKDPTTPMKIADTLARTFPCFSFEFFAPATGEGVPELLETVARLRELTPAFVSVTYSLSEIRRRRTINLVIRIKRELGIEAMAHLTCVGSSRQDIQAKLDQLKDNGIENIMALRGDPPREEGKFRPHPEGFQNSTELVAYVTAQGFCAGGGCYPQVHPDSDTMEEDLAHLVEKVAAGARFLITQAFFDNIHYFAFVERARAAGIRVPIIPGIMPITSARMIQSIPALDPHATIPDALLRELERRAEDPKAVLELGVAHATLQCEELLRCGAPGVHFYTLNTSPATSAILAALKIKQPWIDAREPAPAVLV